MDGWTMGKWISTAVLLPPDDEPVLAVVWAHGKNVRFEGAYCFAEYYPPEGWILTDWPELEIEKVTHWLPLPEPPEEDER